MDETIHKGTVRLIARLDVKGPNLIKGIQFDGHRVLGTPNFFAKLYYDEGIDELIFQDTVASLYRRNSLLDIIRNTAKEVFVPLTVAGGLRSIADIRECLSAGADKVAINTAAIANPDFLKEASETFGSQCIVASLEVYRHMNGSYEVWTDYGREKSGFDAFQWAERVVEMGVGEIMLTSINKEGTGRGFDTDLVSRIANNVPVPVIALGGARRKEDLVDAVKKGKADAVAAASIFHYNYYQPVDKLTMSFNEARLRMGEHIDSGNIDFIKHGYGGLKIFPVTPTSIPEVKKYMRENGIPIRMI
jgi:imidazole glycerol-phosphate synthase subunit HisF